MNIFVLTGAGVSAESGLGTFRDKAGTGIWAKFDPMKLATPEAFAADPETVHAFYNMRRRNLLQAEPNPAHFALARLEVALAERGGHLFLCTQNIDDLHERAGSKRVLHMHGELLKARCIWCEAVTEWRDDLGREDACPSCGRMGGMRPHVVWFGEMPLSMDGIEAGLMGPTCSWQSAPRVRSTRRRASWPKPELPGSGHARSTWSRPTTPAASTSGVTAPQAR